ncbi:hypothetical protein E4188_22515 (plasmid) [Aeromonas media]|uniref:MotA/TolQ/ExbB proton channel domain-containing protein n=1 Tax=Aeromonas media TaxID=651 RepID=A0ABX6P0U0_AERME|nr:hypothetical protein [Aeromonas media]QJT37121.1 hypothetical protein E4187_22805 [Aeromonas media]QJT41275.1 hypothetical protein E4188_22515 [Aeromonas media]
MKDKLQRWPLSITVAVLGSLCISILLGNFTGWYGLLNTGLIAVGISCGFNYMLHKNEQRLTARINSKNTAVWNIMMNGVKTGTVSVSQYADMQRTALRDGRLAVDQCLNLGRVAITFAEKMFLIAPLLFFWGILASITFAPEQLVEVMRMLVDADPVTLGHSIQVFLKLSFIATLISVLFSFIGGYRFGFVNKYDQAVNRMLRIHCNTPVDGDPILFAITTELAPHHTATVVPEK